MAEARIYQDLVIKMTNSRSLQIYLDLQETCLALQMAACSVKPLMMLINLKKSKAIKIKKAKKKSLW